MGITHAEGVDLQEWANAHKPDDDLIYRDGYWHQIIFVRDRLPQPLFGSYEEYKANPVRVVGDHTSKSVLLPVYSIKFAPLEIRMRYNFYDWKVSVVSQVPIRSNFYPFLFRDEAVHPVYFEGFTNDWVFGSYSADNTKFSVEISNEHMLFAFMAILAGDLGLGGNKK